MLLPKHKMKWPISHYVNFDPLKGQHMHDLNRRSLTPISCLFSSLSHFDEFFLYFLY